MQDEPGERWARLRRSLWQPPRPHGEQPRERVVGPLELFYDLAVVVLVAQAAHRLAGFATILLTADPAEAPAMVISDALTERFGAFIIIVLGETLTGVVAGLSSQPINGLTLAVGLTAVVAVACLGVGAARPAPLVLGLVLVVLLSIPWGYAVARRVASGTGSPAH